MGQLKSYQYKWTEENEEPQHPYNSARSRLNASGKKDSINNSDLGSPVKRDRNGRNSQLAPYMKNLDGSGSSGSTIFRKRDENGKVLKDIQ